MVTTNISPQIENVTVLGTGVLGSQIAYQTVYSGFPVTAYDVSDARLDSAKNSFERLAALYEQEVDGAAGGPARAALARIQDSSDLAEAVREADLVIESIPEKLDLKRDVTPWMDAAEYLLLDGVADPETIDKTWRIATGMQQGPCEVMDQIGLNTIYEVNAASDNEKTRAAGAYLKEHYLDKGKLGRPSGEGFYNYAAG
jgi:3-hydroxyacyl-CoA dehydrogenase